jgi:hypothetical protein
MLASEDAQSQCDAPFECCAGQRAAVILSGWQNEYMFERSMMMRGGGFCGLSAGGPGRW